MIADHGGSGDYDISFFVELSISSLTDCLEEAAPCYTYVSIYLSSYKFLT